MKRLSDWCGDNFSGGRITELSVYKGDTYKLELEGGQTFFINCAIVADYDLHEGGEMDAELLEKLQHADKMRKAKKRALYLLGSRMYSYNELYEKLLRPTARKLHGRRLTPCRSTATSTTRTTPGSSPKS